MSSHNAKMVSVDEACRVHLSRRPLRSQRPGAPYFLKVYRPALGEGRLITLAVDGGLPQLRGRMRQVAPGVLQQLVVDDLDALLSDDLAGGECDARVQVSSARTSTGCPVFIASNVFARC